tara:strand:+ start:306 stop:929 length:624 start_codon:yes stop_codon:yes gene_type:complete
MPNPDPLILVRRGTDVQRTDGTLGTPTQSELCYTTDTKALFVGDGATAGAIPATVPASLENFLNTGSQNINAAATNNLVLWNASSPSWGVDISHSTSTDTHKVIINTAGVYEISCTLAVDYSSTAPLRWNGIMRCRLNDTSDFGPQGKGGYIRTASGQEETSLHITTFAQTFAATDYFWVKVDRDTSTTNQVDTTARCSMLYVKRIK